MENKERLIFVDNIRILLIMHVIAHHARQACGWSDITTVAGNSIQATTLFIDPNDTPAMPRRDTGRWSNYILQGTQLKCVWDSRYSEGDKDIDRHGPVAAAVNGNSVSVQYVDEHTVYHWRSSTYGSSMHDGATWS